MSDLIKIPKVVGRPIPVRGNDIDTDQIIPARFMKAVTFDGLGQYAFYDVRYDAEGHVKGHVFDEPRYQAKGVRVAVVNKNFGCGSSREHAPQALMRWGVKAIVGESYADIFFGNCVTMGIPCLTASAAEIGALMTAVEEDPAHDLAVDLVSMRATYRGKEYPVTMPAGPRNQLLEGTWDATRILLSAKEQTEATAARLPYVGGFRRRA
jgi:3-isopropylmalate/(R)-2-methylmalate dehydratase small subunit